MTVFRAISADIENASATAGDDLQSAVARTLARAGAIDRRVVESIVRHARRYDLLVAARTITRAGNGWIYPVIALILLASGFNSAVRCLTAAATSLGIAFLIYPAMKRWFARTRPCHGNSMLADALPPLDRYSFPSGHAMTAAAFSLPLVVAAPPAAAAPIALACALVSWSRIALGHHYLSDIVGGVVVGSSIAAIVSAVLL